MFNKNTYLLPQQDSPSLHSCASTSVLDHNGNEILLHHHDMLSGHYLAGFEGAAGFYNQDVGGLNGEASGMFPICPRTPKRDRHSKINTAQGPRDRRVRLSIGVARKFFDLQEMLGFDKPSKTLDWLLTKSKAAIRDLQNAGTANCSTNVVASPSDECDVENEEAAIENVTSLVAADSKGKSALIIKGAKNPQQILAKESRVKARARARERTREKMCIKQQLNQTRSNTVYDLNPSNIPIQYMNNQLEVCKISSGGGKIHYPSAAYDEECATDGDLIHESVVIKRKVKQPSSILGYQPNLILSSSNYTMPSPYNVNASENWDINAILDQHNKFNNR